jgi:hypothetical protein
MRAAKIHANGLARSRRFRPDCARTFNCASTASR